MFFFVYTTELGEKLPTEETDFKNNTNNKAKPVKLCHKKRNQHVNSTRIVIEVRTLIINF